MARLTAKQRRKLPSKDFALGKGRYPIPDEGHAKAALARVKEYGSPAEQKEVEEKVHKKFPGMTLKGKSAKGERKPKSKSKKKRETRKR